MNRLGKGNKGDAERTDGELVLAARQGDKRAFVEIVARHQAMVCGTALSILGDFAASEDAGQEAFLTAWRKFHELREPERLRPWLAQIARNAALGHRRRKRGEAPLEAVEILPDESPAPDEVAATEEEAELVRDSLAKLPEICRLPLILFYREGQSVRAVAESLAISEDAVKQRLARGREMLRDRMSGLVETVLKRSTPTAVFTMTVAVAIGALAAPAAIAASAFAASTSTSSSILAAMSTSKTILATAAVVTAVCIPVGYYVSGNHESALPKATSKQFRVATNRTVSTPDFENTALFREWRDLHDKYGRRPEAMPAIYKAIADMKDPFRRRSFRAALIAEWVQLDAKSGLAFFMDKKSDTSQRKQFLEEWLAQDARTAVGALLASGTGWEGMARDNLPEIARRVPERLAELVSRLQKSDNFWDTKVRDAFAILADGGLANAKATAEKITGPNREQALSGIAQSWAKNDFQGALGWAKGLPAGIDRDEIIRSALMGRAALDPATALDSVGLVPPGGRDGYFATTTGARVLSAAAKADYDATVAWVAAHPTRLGHEDMLGLAQAVTDRLNTDPVGFLSAHAAAGSLSAILPAIDSALLNEASGQRPAVWEWLKTQPETDVIKAIKEEVLRSAAWQDTRLAMRLADEIPDAAKGQEYLKTIARSLFNGGSRINQFDRFLAEAPDRLRPALCEEAFNSLTSSTMDDPQRWIARLPQLPEASRARGIEAIARAWSQQRPDEAAQWAVSLPPSDARESAMAAAISNWGAQDAHSAAEWLASLAPGPERDRSAQSFVSVVANKYPSDAWQWALSIEDPQARAAAATTVANAVAARDPATALQWVDSGALPPETKNALHSSIEATSKASRK
ncbi:MAG TPA: sigma-70 family RNA polymerase sigma factor [Verrucomicrobiae bacterium]|nr:sigma-70 family RNA polymerase sigma factor [Verrucomicrobiae bacterium]